MLGCCCGGLEALLYVGCAVFGCAVVVVDGRFVLVALNGTLLGWLVVVFVELKLLVVPVVRALGGRSFCMLACVVADVFIGWLGFALTA